jgi:hypothetical protein
LFKYFHLSAHLLLFSNLDILSLADSATLIFFFPFRLFSCDLYFWRFLIFLPPNYSTFPYIALDLLAISSILPLFIFRSSQYLKDDYLRNQEFARQYPNVCESFNFQDFPLLHSALNLNFLIFITAWAKLAEFVCCCAQLNHRFILLRLKAAGSLQLLRNLKSFIRAFFLFQASKLKQLFF